MERSPERDYTGQRQVAGAAYPAAGRQASGAPYILHITAHF